MPNAARILVLPGPPKILPSTPSVKSRRISYPDSRREIVVVASEPALGIPGSPGTTQPKGAVGNCVDCRPGTMVSILP